MTKDFKKKIYKRNFKKRRFNPVLSPIKEYIEYFAIGGSDKINSDSSKANPQSTDKYAARDQRRKTQEQEQFRNSSKRNRSSTVNQNRSIGITVSQFPIPGEKRKRNEVDNSSIEKRIKIMQEEEGKIVKGLKRKGDEMDNSTQKKRIKILQEDEERKIIKGLKRKGETIDNQKKEKIMKSSKDIVKIKEKDCRQDFKNKFDNWNCGELLGKGGFGEVYKLYNKSTNEEIALKIIEVHDAESMTFADKEILIQRNCDYDHVVKFIDSERFGDVQFIYMEFMNGGSLEDRIVPNKGVNPKNLKFYFRQILVGLDYLHSMGIMHGDLKPANILRNTSGLLKISDFGLSEVFKKGKRKVKLMNLGGTPSIMAPEVFVTDTPFAAEPVDIWGLGIVLCMMAFGEEPWIVAKDECNEYKNWTEGIISYHPWSKINGQLFHLVSKMLTRKPYDRFSIYDIMTNLWTMDNTNLV